MSAFKTLGVLGRLRGAVDVIAGKAEAVAPGTGDALAKLAENTVGNTDSMTQAAEALEILRAEVKDLYVDRDRYRHKADKLFALVEGVLAERDTYQNMFKIHTSEHLNAQHLLESALTRTRDMLVKTIKIVNGYRDRDGQPRLESPADIDAASAPVGVAKAFAEKMKALEADPAEAYERIPHDPSSAFESPRTRSMRVGIGNQPTEKIIAERDRIMAEESLEDES